MLRLTLRPGHAPSQGRTNPDFYSAAVRVTVFPPPTLFWTSDTLFLLCRLPWNSTNLVNMTRKDLRKVVDVLICHNEPVGQFANRYLKQPQVTGAFTVLSSRIHGSSSVAATTRLRDLLSRRSYLLASLAARHLAAPYSETS